MTQGNTKRVVFYETDDRQARFRIRLKEDNLRQSEFFRMLISYYLDNDDRILSILSDYKKQIGIRDKVQQKYRKKLIDEGKETKKKFALNEEDIESIFDLMEKEFPDL